MTAILAGGSTFLDCGSGGSASPTTTITVPIGCTRLMVGPTIGSSRTVSSITFNGMPLSQVSDSLGTNVPGNSSASWWTLTNPTVGAHTIIMNLSGAARGGAMIMFIKGDTGIGAANGQPEAFALLSGVADSSLVVFLATLSDDSTVGAAGPFLNNTFSQKLSDGAGVSSFISFCATMRGYPGVPALLQVTGAGPANTCASAVEITGMGDVI